MPDLYLKNEKVLSFEEKEGETVKIGKVFAPELLPIPLTKECSVENFNKWQKGRRIPEKREGLNKSVSMHGKDWMINKNHASLTDQYWVRKRDEKWKTVNFFNNMYGTDVGDILFSPDDFYKKKNRIYNYSPELTTGGIVRKKWIQKDVKNRDFTSFLIKASSTALNQEPLNEVLASRFAERLNKIKCVHYDLYIEKGEICSIGQNFVTENTELVPSNHIYYLEPREKGESILQHILRMCEKLDIPDAEEYIHWLTYIDYCTGNEDRNLSNIGFIRDVNTMKFIGPAPMYDSANAYWCGKPEFKTTKKGFLENDEKKIVDEMKKKADIDFNKEAEECGEFLNTYRYMEEKDKEKLIKGVKEHYKNIEKNKSEKEKEEQREI